MILSQSSANITFQPGNLVTIIFSLLAIGAILLLTGYVIRRRE